jgi:hypothetical protein
MQESKNSFLKGKMNKDLDDRLVPNGEYRDAFNVNTSRSDNSNVGTAENIRGNSVPYAELLNLTSNIEGGSIDVIGHYVDDKDDRIFWFVTDFSYSPTTPHAGEDHTCEVYMYDQKANYVQKILQGYFLNFSKNYLITGISIIDNLLFWTDDFNAPRRINITTALNSVNNYTTESQISITRTAPFKAPLLLKQDKTRGMEFIPDLGADIRSRYIEEKFIRLSYRFKFFDNEFSTIAPFTQHCFMPMNSPTFHTWNRGGGMIDANVDKQAYSETEMPLMVNAINQVNMTIELPSENVASDYHIKGIEILMKESEASAVKVISYIDLRTHTKPILYFTYKANNPYKVLSSDQLLRTYDKVPIKAKAQEVIGNRIVYGNFEQNYDLPELKYRVEVDDKSEALWLEYPNHTVKQRRNYQVGVVLKDRFGRETPVILPEDTQASTIYVNAEPARAHKNSAAAGVLSAVPWVGQCLQMIWRAPIPDACQLVNVYDPSTFTLDTWTSATVTLDVTATILSVPGNYVTLLPVGSYLVGPAGVGYTEILSVVYDSGISKTVITTATAMNSTYSAITSASVFTYYTLYKKTDTAAPGIWESYKIVIKQKEQEYYNVYHTGALNYKNKTYITLSGNNINKIPRDTSNVSATTGLSSTKVKLFPKTVYLNVNTLPTLSTGTVVKQGDYFASTVSTINVGTASEHGFVRSFVDNQSAVGLVYTGVWASGATYVKQDAVNYSGITYYCIKDHTGVSLTPNVNTVNWQPLGSGISVGQGYGEPYGTTENHNNWNWIYEVEKDPLMVDLYDKSWAPPPAPNTLPIYGADPVINNGTAYGGAGWFAATPKLTVFETQPFESDLDLFWETSTTGYVAELNELIGNSPDYPLNIELIGTSALFLESLPANSIIPGLRLNADASVGSIVGYELVSAKDFAVPIPNDCTNRFTIVFDGTYWRIKTLDVFHWKTNTDEETQSFRLTVKASQNDGTGVITTANQDLDIFLQNAAPTLTMSAGGARFVLTSPVLGTKYVTFASTQSPIPSPLHAVSGRNGSANFAESQQELVYSMQVTTNDGFPNHPFYINSTTGAITMDCRTPGTNNIDLQTYWNVSNTGGYGTGARWFQLTLKCEDAFGNPAFVDWGGLQSNTCVINVYASNRVRVLPITEAQNPNAFGTWTLHYTSGETGLATTSPYSKFTHTDIHSRNGTSVSYSYTGPGGSTPQPVPAENLSIVGMF